MGPRHDHGHNHDHSHDHDHPHDHAPHHAHDAHHDHGHGSEHDDRHPPAATHKSHPQPPGHGGHSHGPHAHHVPSGPHAASRIGQAFFLIVFVLVVEVWVAIISHSLALLADAGHVLTDLIALALSWFAIRQAGRPPTKYRTYGFHRTGIMVALFNAASLILIAVYILHEAVTRLFVPVAISGGPMMGAALVGLVVNLWIGFDLSREQGDNLNVKSAVLHVMGDAAASLGVIVAAAMLWLVPRWTWLDPTIAALIAFLIAFGAWQIMHDAAVVLMEGVPSHINMDWLVQRITEVPGVEGVHDLHVWCIASGLPVLTCHVLLRELDIVSSADVLNRVRDMLLEQFGIQHCTVQPEWELCGPANLYCRLEGPNATAQADEVH